MNLTLEKWTPSLPDHSLLVSILVIELNELYMYLPNFVCMFLYFIIIYVFKLRRTKPQERNHRRKKP